MLLWLVDQLPELFSFAATTAFSMEEGFGPDVLCGVLDGLSGQDPLLLWDKVSKTIDLTKVGQNLRHVSRMAVLLRLARRAAEAGLTPAKAAIGNIETAFSKRCGVRNHPMLRYGPIALRVSGASSRHWSARM